MDGRLPLALVLALTVGMLAQGAYRRGSPLPRPRVPAPLFDPSDAHSMLESPERDQWQQPERLVKALALQPGETVADLGSGSGYLLPHLSRAVGPSGTVIAEEVQESYLPSLRQRADRLGNVRVVLGTVSDPGLERGSVDCQVLLTVYHEVQSPTAFLRTLRRAARPGGRLAIIDFDGDRSGNPPAPLEHQVATEAVLAEARAAGWALEQRHEFLGSQFFLIFRNGEPHARFRP